MDKDKVKEIMPICYEVIQGHSYYWCRCSQSSTPPFYDEHNCECQPIEYVASQSENITFCNCKQTKHPPFCDGSHAKLLIELLKSKSPKSF